MPRRMAYVLLSAAFLAGLMGASADCSLGLSFFPTGSGDTNTPYAWTQTNQSAAGNNALDQMLTTLINGVVQPSVQVQPVSQLLNAGATLTSDCVPAPAAARKLSQAAPTYILVTPGTFQLQYNFNNQGLTTVGTYYSGNATTPVPRVNLTQVSDSLADGHYCVNITLTLLANTAAVKNNDTGATMQLPAADQVVWRNICFYKMSARPSATVTMSSCAPNFTVTANNILPVPVLADDGTPLFQTVVQIWALQSSEFDGSVSLAYDSQVDNRTKYFQYFQVFNNPNATQAFTLSSDMLVDGYYNFQVTAAISSTKPTLINVNGADTWQQGPSSILGSAKFLGIMLVNVTNVGIQSYASQLSGIAGPTAKFGADTVQSFSWKVLGHGMMTCAVDATAFSNVANSAQCIPPADITVPDTANHTLQVQLVDVCGNVLSSKATYSASFGSIGNGKTITLPNGTVVAADGTTTTTVDPSTTTTTKSKNAAATMVPSVLAAFVALLGAALML